MEISPDKQRSKMIDELLRQIKTAENNLEMLSKPVNRRIKRLITEMSREKNRHTIQKCKAKLILLGRSPITEIQTNDWEDRAEREKRYNERFLNSPDLIRGDFKTLREKSLSYEHIDSMIKIESAKCATGVKLTVSKEEFKDFIGVFGKKDIT